MPKAVTMPVRYSYGKYRINAIFPVLPVYATKLYVKIELSTRSALRLLGGSWCTMSRSKPDRAYSPVWTMFRCERWQRPHQVKREIPACYGASAYYRAGVLIENPRT
jgi:hypothetical protein